MVFRTKDANTFKLRLTLAGRKPRTVSTGATDKATAEDVEAMVKRFKGRRDAIGLRALAAVLDDDLSLGAVYDAHCHGTLTELVADLTDTDLEPLVAEWAKKANAKYVRQVRALIVEGERFPVSRFRRRVVSEFLAGLTCSDPTKNRYRAALSVFAKWLVEREVIDANPVRDVAMYTERDPRMVWMSWDDAERAAEHAPEPWASLFLLMAMTGIELGAALKLTRTDVDLSAKTIRAQGSKTTWRNRVVRYDPDRLQGVMYRLTAGKDESSPLFPAIRHRVLLAQWHAAQKAAGLSGHRLHDLRHTYAVNALKAGLKPTVVAHQLGHKDASMVIKVYGRFVPDAADYAVPKKKALVTNSVTSIKKQREAKRAK
jgi:integrase